MFLPSYFTDESHGATHINIGSLISSKIGLCTSYLEKGAELQSSSANSLWNLSLCYLLLGRFSEGWKFYEARYQTDMFSKCHIPTVGPRIDHFSDLPTVSDQPLVVWSEQGMGDSIQFFRYLFLLEAADIPFEFHSRPQLIALFKQWSPFPEKIVPERSTILRLTLVPIFLL